MLYHEIEELELEIERLRNELTERIHMCDMRSEKIIELTDERDEARRMYCKAVADHYEYACNAELDGAGPYTQKDVAKDEGWDCFKEDGKLATKSANGKN